MSGGTLNFFGLIYKLYLRKFELFRARLLKKRGMGVKDVPTFWLLHDRNPYTSPLQQPDEKKQAPRKALLEGIEADLEERRDIIEGLCSYERSC